MLFVRTKLKHCNLNIKLFQITYNVLFLKTETFTISFISNSVLSGYEAASLANMVMIFCGNVVSTLLRVERMKVRAQLCFETSRFSYH